MENNYESQSKDVALLRFSSLLCQCAKAHVIKKSVFSKPVDRSLVRAVACEISISGRPCLQIEFFHTDNKVTHKNLPLQTLDAGEIEGLVSGFMQVNLICHIGECEYRRSAKGRSVILNEKKLSDALASHLPVDLVPARENDRKKKHILCGDEPFLKLLGISDENGRIHDKKQAKFKQINRFLEIIQDCEDRLPHDSIRICDLCCGKSYLSFAVYHYFSVIRKMEVSMTGVDLKADVVEYCSDVAARLGFSGLEFVCADIQKWHTDVLPSLVISLHACDMATDIVLQKAADWGTEVILSTPCCHHELNHAIDCPTLSFITEHSMLRQKLCDAATDALRLCRLEARGYSTSTLELIDPNETPKNVMLRAFKKKRFDPLSKEARDALERYERAKAFLCGEADTSSLHF